MVKHQQKLKESVLEKDVVGKYELELEYGETKFIITVTSTEDPKEKEIVSGTGTPQRAKQLYKFMKSMKYDF